MSPFIQAVIKEVKRRRRIDLSMYRQDMLERRIRSRMNRIQIADPDAYIRILKEQKGECTHLINSIGVNVSSFFRDPMVFEILENKILPAVIARKRLENSREIRIWSAGCSAGEEPYSIAILVRQCLEKEISGWRTYIFATDMDSEAVEHARTALYPRESLQSVKLGVVDKYFISKGNLFQPVAEIKDMVHFSIDDCATMHRIAPAESIYGNFDMIFCRNVMIYFSKDLQLNLLNKFSRALVASGYLVLGTSEALCVEVESDFKTIDAENRIYRKKC